MARSSPSSRRRWSVMKANVAIITNTATKTPRACRSAGRGASGEKLVLTTAWIGIRLLPCGAGEHLRGAAAGGPADGAGRPVGNDRVDRRGDAGRCGVGEEDRVLEPDGRRHTGNGVGAGAFRGRDLYPVAYQRGAAAADHDLAGGGRGVAGDQPVRRERGRRPGMSHLAGRASGLLRGERVVGDGPARAGQPLHHRGGKAARLLDRQAEGEAVCGEPLGLVGYHHDRCRGEPLRTGKRGARGRGQGHEHDRDEP